MLHSRRLLLRPHGLADFEAMTAMFSEAEVVRFLGGKPMAREDVWARLLRYVGHWSLFGYGLFAVVEKDTGRYLGGAGLATFERGLGDRFDPFPEAAWTLATAAHGRGYATEAATVAHAWFDATQGARRTVCIIRPDNIGSLRVAAKLGYRPFGETPYKDAAVMQFEREP